MDITRFRRRPLLGILRGVTAAQVTPVLEAAAAGGLEAIEITMNTAGAPALIAGAARTAREKKLMLGAGTVLDVDAAKAALDAGATFIVMPVVVEEVMACCAARKVPVFPGALTPAEVYRAHRLGAAMVKVFPAGVFGPRYFRDLRGPFGDIELLACGGVTPENLREYRACGAAAAAFGGSVFKKEWLAAGDFGKIEAAVREFVEAL